MNPSTGEYHQHHPQPHSQDHLFRRHVVYHCYREQRTSEDAFLHLAQIYGEMFVPFPMVEQWYREFNNSHTLGYSNHDMNMNNMNSHQHHHPHHHLHNHNNHNNHNNNINHNHSHHYYHPHQTEPTHHFQPMESLFQDHSSSCNASQAPQSPYCPDNDLVSLSSPPAPKRRRRGQIMEEEIAEYLRTASSSNTIPMAMHFNVEVDQMRSQLRKFGYRLDDEADKWVKMEPLTDERLRQFVEDNPGSASIRKVAAHFHIGRGEASKRLKAIGLYNERKKRVTTDGN